MSASEPTKLSERTLAQDLGAFAGYWLRDRRVQIALAIAVAGTGAALNWGWLVAVGVAPLLLSLAPCAVMCALGLCMMGRGGQASCSKAAADATPRLNETTGVRSEASALPSASFAAAALPAPRERSDAELQLPAEPEGREAIPAEPEEERQVEGIGKGGERCC